MAIENTVKDVKYLDKDFIGFRNYLVELAKIYYPNSYKDFNESSPGMMFIEMASSIGDVLSYYIDANLKESLLYYAEEKHNIINLAQTLGYKHKVTTPSTTVLDVYQLVPSTGYSGSFIDTKYCLKINSSMIVQSSVNSSLMFRTINPVDFSITSSNDFESTVYEVDSNGNPARYLLKKQVDAVAGNVKTYNVTITDPIQFYSFQLPDLNVIEILEVKDLDNNIWYEVDYLAQDSIFVDEENIFYSEYSQDRESAPYILKIKRISKRFTTRINENGYTELHFGAGTSSYPDELIVPNPNILNFKNLPNYNLDPNNFLYTKTYGQVPSNTTLTITYTVGGGVSSNCNQGEITSVLNATYKNSDLDFVTSQDRELFRQTKLTLGVNNSEPATGGSDEETLDEIKQNAMAFFNSQNRCVTLTDYTIRALSMPQKYGSIAKAFSRKNTENFTIDLFCLGYDSNKNLINLNDTIKNNLKTYLTYFSDVNSIVKIGNAYVVNIGVKFDIITYPKYNKDEVLLACIEEIKNYFDIDKWQINQPIILSELYNILDKVTGVRTISNIVIENKYNSYEGYNENRYNIETATRDDIIYPSADPMIFQIMFPSIDINGAVR